MVLNTDKLKRTQSAAGNEKGNYQKNNNRAELKYIG